MSKPPANSLWNRLSILTLIRFLLLFACGWALVQLLEYFKTVIVIFTFAAILAFLLSYPVRSLKRYLPHGIAVVIVFLLSLLLVIGITATVGLTVLAQGQQLVDRVIEFLNSLAPAIEQLEQFLRARNLRVNLTEIEGQLRDQILAGIGIGLTVVPAFLANLVNLILITVVAFYMLLDGKRLWGFILRFLPRHFRSYFTLIIQRNFLGFFRGRLLLALFLASSTFIGLVALQSPFALFLAVIVGALDLVPGIGATLGISLVFLILLSQDVWLALRFFALSIFLQQVEENVLAPRIMRNSLNINPVVMFFSLLIGVRVAGLLGIFLAIPVAGVIVSLLEMKETDNNPILSEEVPP